MRFDERELLMPVGVAGIEEDDLGRQMVVLRLSFVDRRMFLPVWDVLALAGIDPRVVSRYLRRRARAKQSSPGRSGNPA